MYNGKSVEESSGGAPKLLNNFSSQMRLESRVKRLIQGVKVVIKGKFKLS